MVGWLDMGEDKRSARPEAVSLLELPLLRTSLPPQARPWRVRRALRALARQGVRRILLPPDFTRHELLNAVGLVPVSPLRLCRAMAVPMAKALLAPTPPRQRVVLLRGYGNSAGLLPPLAEALCPLTGTLIADTDRGFDAMSDHLRSHFGAALLAPAQGPPPQVSVELSPGPESGGKRLKLWGPPDLAGLTLTPTGLDLPQRVDSLPLMALLWETGRLEIGQILVSEPGLPLDIDGKKSYNS